MKIEFEIPDFVPEARIIHIFAGMHRIGYILPDGRQFVKISECSQCGKCCQKMNCEHLEKEPGDNDKWRCGLGLMRPYTCCISEPKSIPGCTSKYKEIK